jgi:serine protease DegQ
MGRILLLVVQLALAALAGYWGGQHAGRVNEAALPPVLPAPATRPAPPPEPPAVAARDQQAAAGPAGATAVNLSISYRTAVERAAPSVVTVHSARTAARGPLGIGGRKVLSRGLGSGVLIDDRGHIVTNNHVVEGATELAVGLPDGTLRRTRLLGVDPDTDLAVLQVDPTDLTPIQLGDPRTLAVGDVVLAVGNPLGVGQTVTQGIVSAVGRKGIGINPIENFIQTDAAINPGNSGGALIDTAGRLVGINSAILSRGGGSEGIGFAIPVDLAIRVAASLEKQGRVARGYLGVSTEPPPRGQAGVVIAAVQRGGPADRGGLQPGDHVLRVGQRPIEQPGDLASVTMDL